MVAVVDYDAGNLRSVETALNHLGVSFETSSDPRRLSRADKIIFPGVGQAAHAMAHIRERRLDEVLETAFREERPVLGICVGSQVVLEHSQEGNCPCLGLLAGSVRSLATDFEERGLGLKVPHIGWNQVHYAAEHPAAPLFNTIPQDSSFYFVHSFYPQPSDESLVLGRTDYGLSFASVYAKGALLACQFHPEKSGPVGLALLDNFMRLF